jgi:putative intracellular protease/amidase
VARVLLPVPDHDFDVTEVAVPWKLLSDAGHEVVFATERGAAGEAPAADPLLLSGVMFGRLGAAAEPVKWYGEMTKSREFQRPMLWSAIEPGEFGGLLLPGGHAPGMRQYLGSTELQRKVAAFCALGRPVAAICHGVLVLARAKDADGHSPLHDKRTTCLPKYLERSAFLLTAWRRGRYYRTYPAYVETEVRAALDSQAQFVRGPRVATARGTATDDSHAFVVEDGNYVSARWPGDAYLFARTFIGQLS